MSGRPPRTYKVECLVLARRTIGEADSILTVFSRERGRFDAVARGVRKARSHMRGHLEPLTRTRALLAQGRTLDVFTQAEALDPYRLLHEDLDRYAAAVYAAELVRRFAPEREPLPWLFELATALFELLDGGGRLSSLRAFEMALLDGAGYAPRVDACAGCGERLPEAEAFLSPAAGGLLCRSCRADGSVGRLVSSGAIKVLRFAARASLAEFAALRMSDALDAEVEGATRELLHYVLDDLPRSGQFLQEVRALYRPATGAAPAGPADVESEHATTAD